MYSLRKCFLILFFCLTAAPVLNAKLYIAKEDTKVREGKGSHFKELGTLKKGEEIEIAETTGLWRKVEEEGVVGYVNSHALEEAPEEVAQAVANDEIGHKAEKWVKHHVVVSIGLGIVLLLILRSIMLGISARRAEKNAVHYEEKYKSLIKFWFQCKHCAASIKNDTEPSANGCSRSLHHHWTKLGEVGQHKFHCKNCNVTINTKMDPSDHGCPSSTLHRWERKGNK